MTENEEIKNIIKESLKIVDQLAELNFNGTDELIDLESEFAVIVKRAKNLKRNRLWKLK